MTRTILLISHGPMAEAMIASAAMLFQTTNVFSECLYENDLAETFQTKIESYITEYEQLLILCDLPGGTPCNCALKCQKDPNRVKIIAGMNLPLLLEAMMADSNMPLSDLCIHLLAQGKDNCKMMDVIDSCSLDELDEEMEE